MTNLPVAALERFDQLYGRALASGLRDANAMHVATVGADGRPASRIVLLKGHDATGFVFYTNRESRKGVHLAARPHVALCFYWNDLHEQVRVEGVAAPVADAEADAYFASRARMSQVGAWASRQSEPLDSRATFERAIAEVDARYAGRDVPRPPHWSGYRVRPERIEFWRGIENRLHERTVYWLEDGAWRTGLLYPLSDGMLHCETLTVDSRGRGTVELTARVQDVVRGCGVDRGLCHVFIHHTSASLMLCENADRDVLRDLERFMSRLVPDGDPLFVHTAEGPDDMPAHVRSVLTQSGLSVPVRDGRCDLGTWQGIYLWEHRRAPHRRRLTVSVQGADP